MSFRPDASGMRNPGFPMKMGTQFLCIAPPIKSGDGVWIPASGLELRDNYAHRDAKKVFKLIDVKEEKTSGCICGKIILGKAYPSDCKLFKKICSPKNPKGPCMVSHEGACNIWYKTN